MNRSIWIPVVVTVAMLGAAGLAGSMRSPAGAQRAVVANAGAGAASAWSAVSAAGAAQFERLGARAWFATHSLRAGVGRTLPAVPLEPVAWASMALATFAFVRALQIGRRAPAPHRGVLRLARHGMSSTHIARRTHMSQDAVRSLLQPAGQGSGRTGRHGLPFGRIGRRAPASDTGRGPQFNAMA